MNPAFLWAFGLVLGALALAALSKRLELPYPIVLVIAGIALSLTPSVPAIHLDPEIVFFVLLPPVLFEAAYFTSWRDFWRWKRAIFMLAFGLVTATSALVALLCVTFIPGMSWAAGFVLGAIVSPPDAAAATAITRGLHLPRRIVQILEGESLVNDAAGLTVYRFAIAAVVTGAFSWGDATLAFLWIALGGCAIGALLGWAFVRLHPKLKDPEVEILSTFLLCYSAYYLAELVHASGVLSTVAAGLVLGWHSSTLFSAAARIRGLAVWQIAIFLVNAAIFLLIGLQLPGVYRTLREYPIEMILFWCVIIVSGVIAVRILWVFPGAYLPRLLPSIRRNEPPPSWQQVTIVGWTGLRGVVSLAGALAIPRTTAAGEPFPYRELIELLTFAVILATLLIQGLTLRPLLRLLRIPQDHSSESESLAARLYSTERAVARLLEISGQPRAYPEPVLARVRGFFEDQLADLRAQQEEAGAAAAPDQPEQFQTLIEQRLWYELARVQRDALLELRRGNKIGDEALREIEHDLDLLEARLVPRSYRV
jgi:CPA1 family monovalent cation:H+ antiporter